MWIPYRSADQELLNNAFEKRQDRCHVVNDKYRVIFDEEGTACGEQFKNGVKDPINHMVVNGEPEDGLIHGMGVADNPK